MGEVSAYPEKFGFSVSRHFNKVQEDKRFGKTTTHVVQLYGHGQLVKWVTEIGFRNSKHLRKVKLWIEANKTTNGQSQH